MLEEEEEEEDEMIGRTGTVMATQREKTSHIII